MISEGMEFNMLFELKQFIRNHIIYLFMAPKNDITKFVSSEYQCEENADYIINSSIVMRCKVNGEDKYFRECLVRRNFKEYLANALDDYFDNIEKSDKKRQVEEAVRKDISNKANYRKLCRINSVFNRHLMEILSGEYSDYNQAGLPSFKEMDCRKEFISFITYISCILISYKANAYVKKGNYERGSAYKQLATYEIALLLGLSSLITPVRLCKLQIGGKNRIGTLMDKARGKTPAYILPEARKAFSQESFLKELTGLEYLDGLCYQLDHRLDNYNVIENDEVIVGVEAFDNDANRTFFTSSKFPGITYAGASCILTKDGKINRPYMDSELAKRIISINRETLYKAVGMYLSKCQFRALWARFTKLQSAIEEASKINNEFLVENWNLVDVERELDPKYGKTYFYLYINDTVMLDREKEFKK